MSFANSLILSLLIAGFIAVKDGLVGKSALTLAVGCAFILIAFVVSIGPALPLR